MNPLRFIVEVGPPEISADDYTLPEELAASPSVLEMYRYQQVEDIQRDASALIARAEQKAKELAGG